MIDHPSNPDRLMARALGVCWHSPTSDRWPCGPLRSCGAPAEPTHGPCIRLVGHDDRWNRQPWHKDEDGTEWKPEAEPESKEGEPLADWERELAHREFRAAHQTCGCDQDPIECNHEAALGQAEEKLRKVQRLLAFYNSNDPEFRGRHEKYFLRALGETEIRPEWSWSA